MDIEKIKKQNQMAAEYKKHKFLDSAKVDDTGVKETTTTDNNVLDEVKKDLRKLVFSLQRQTERVDELQNELKKLKVTVEDNRKEDKIRGNLSKEPTHKETKKTENKDNDKPIDRNDVAPSDVSVEKIFNCSNKKF